MIGTLIRPGANATAGAANIAPIPPDEAVRLARLREMFVLDTPAEPLFDSFAQMASQICGTPIALITLIDQDRQWFKANVGLPGITETPRGEAFCSYAIMGDAVFEVRNAERDSRFSDFPAVAGEARIRFYAGAPLILASGERIGTLCVLDRQPNALSAEQSYMLQSLSDMVVKALAMRSQLITRSLSVRSDYERSLADLYDKAPCGYHSLDANGLFTRINDLELSWLGCSREEAIGKLGIVDFLDADGKALFANHFPQLRAEGYLNDLQFNVVSRNGEVRRVIASATVLKDVDGHFASTRTALHDVTQLQRAQDELRRATHEQRLILDTDLIGMVRLRNRVMVWANAGMRSLLGYEPGELLGRSTRLLFTDDEAYREVGDEAYETIRRQDVFRKQIQFVSKDGRRVWVDMHYMGMQSTPGDFLCMLVDITPLRQAEEIRMRGAALEAENRQLVESNRVKGVFLTNMSHELRTPLNAVIGYAGLLAAGTIKPGSPKFAPYLEQIGSSGRQLLGLIDSVLNFANIESGKIRFNPQPVVLPALVKDVCELLRPEIERKSIHLVIEIDPDIEPVSTDPLRLTQVLAQFLSNAVKFSARGGTVTLRARIEPMFMFRVEVQDFGIGIAEKDLPRLFTAFQQLSEGNSKAFPGAGLGLALARKLVEGQGGTVGVTSREGVGSTFHLLLPK